MKRHKIRAKTTGVLLSACLILGSLVLPASAQESRGLASPGIKPKSESTALALSLVGTLVPYGLIAWGSTGYSDYTPGLIGYLTLPVGPSLGYFYAEAAGRGFAGIGIRFVGLAAFLFGAFIAADEGDSALAGVLTIGGGLTVIGSTIFDLTNLNKAVRKRNLKAAGKSLNVAPVLAPRSKTVGLTLQLGF